MSIALRSVGHAVVLSASPSNTFTCPKPEDLAEGDLMVASVATNGVAVAAADGWTDLFDLTDAGNPDQRVMYRLADADDVAAASFDFPITQATYGVVVICAYTGVDPHNPIDFTCDPIDTSASLTQFTVPAGSVVTGGAILIGGAAANTGMGASSPMWSAPTGPDDWTDEWNPASGAGGAEMVSGAKSHFRAHCIPDPELAAEDSTGDMTFTLAQARAGNAWVAGLRPDTGAGPTPTLVQPAFLGSPAPGGVTAAVRTSNASSVRLKVATNSTLTTGVVYSQAQVPDADGRAKLVVTGLAPDTTYHYGVELDGVVDTAKQGTFTTLPKAGAPASFSFGMGSCMSTGVATDAMTRCRARGPRFFLQMGDFHYNDVSSSDPADYRAAYDAQLQVPSIAAMLSNVPTVYAWSDHDYQGNNTHGGATNKAVVQAVYRQLIPHLALPAADSIQQTFVVGRVRFIVTDERSHKSAQSATDDASKTMLGATQKAWFKDLVDSCPEKVILWVGDTPWTGAKVAGDDHWASYDTERQELADHFAASGKHVIRLAGDAHMLAADDGTNSPGGIPVLQAAPLNRTASRKGGPWTSGPYPDSGNSTVRQYGFVEVTDDGETIEIEFTGYDTDDVARATWSDSYEVGAVEPLPTQWESLMLGSTPVEAAYVGAVKVWERED